MNSDTVEPKLKIVGGGLAGVEAAWQAANIGIKVILYEMRPLQTTAAHQTDLLAELVCSNSLGSNLPDRASGVLKSELRLLNSLVVDCAEQTSLPAGGALAVDRTAFASLITERITKHQNITLVREEVTTIPAEPTIIASGPLTSSALTKSLSIILDHGGLAFYDAIAPIIESSSINMDIAYRASRYGRGEESEGDYINCPFSKDEYTKFVSALISAQRITLHTFEEEINTGVKGGMHKFFEGCLPIEIIAARGFDALAYGPMRPIGLKDPRTGRHPYAVVQLRQDNIAGSLYNLVGFQTNLTFTDQKRIFRLIPGLEQANFERFGQMHRNTFIASPLFLKPTLQFHTRPDLFFAGQITGVEGYMGNAATGLLAGINAGLFLTDQTPLVLPIDTMLGALLHYITHADLKDFQPMKANFGIMPELESKLNGKRTRAKAYSERAKQSMVNFLNTYFQIAKDNAK